MRRVIASVLLPTYLVACSAWEVQTQVTPQQAVAQELHLDLLHVTLSDGSWVVLEDPEISGDSLTGVVSEGAYRGQPVEPGLLTAVDVGDVVEVAVQKKSARATALPWVVGAVAVAAAVAVVAYAQLKDMKPIPIPPSPW
jgi:hypothetical protein